MNAFERYVRGRYKAAAKYLDRFLELGYAEDLHRFRVECKKIKALTAFCGYLHPDEDWKKVMRPLQRVYRLSGHLRDEEVMHGLLQRYHISLTSEARAYAETLLTEDPEKAFRAAADKWLQHPKAPKKLLKTAHMATIEALKEYLADTLHAVTAAAQSDDYLTHLHEHRKSFKAVKYLSALEKGVIPYPVVRRCKTLEEHIGQWHDKTVLVNYLEQVQPNQRLPIRHLEQVSAKEAGKIRQRILELPL